MTYKHSQPSAAPQALGNITVGPVFSTGALLPDASITASACYSGCSGGGHEAWKGRLFNAGEGYVPAWASQSNIVNSDYLQFDLGSVKPIDGVSTQSRGNDCCASQRVTAYQVQISSNGTTWTTVPGGPFTANTAVSQTAVTNMFPQKQEGRYVRIVPTSFTDHMSMRAEIISIPCTGPATVYASAEKVAYSSTVNWHTGSSGGTAFASGRYTGSNISSNTTIYAAASNNGCESATRTPVTLQVGTPPSASITSSSSNTCYGNSFSLGGNVTASGAWTLNLSPSGSVSGTGNASWSLPVSPSSTTTYSITSMTGPVCASAATFSGSTTLTLPPTGTALGNNTDNATCTVNNGNWVHFYHSSGRLLASINSGGQNLGNVTVTSYVDGSPVITQACGTTSPQWTTAALGRRWVITPQFQPATPVSVRLPFGDAEFSALQTAAAGTTSNPNDNVSTISNLKISKYSGTNQDGNYANNCTAAGGSGGTLIINQSGNGTVTTGNGFPANVASSSYVQVSVPGFSEFWLHNTGSLSPLPVELTNFSANCNEVKDVELHWTTASEQNSQKFIVEKSRDLMSWSYAAEIPAAGNSSQLLNYSMTDTDPLNGTSYYRLVQVDNDGEETVYGPVSAECGYQENSITVFPNPANDQFTVEIFSSENVKGASLQIVDLTGKLVSLREIDLVAGNNQALFQDALRMGTYFVRVLAPDNEFETIKLIIN